jgi:hypothetical protein
MIPVQQRARPRPEHRALYDRHYGVFQQLYRRNRPLFRLLNDPQ